MTERSTPGGCCKMRKYSQLLLLILSAISILCFVFYKHEYDRLRKVLEVLDFFGSPVTELGDKALIPMSECKNGSVEFIPDLWRLYEDEIYFYSSFQTANEKGWSMNSLATVGKESSAARKRSSCALLSGDGTADDHFEGTIEWKQIANDSTSLAFSVICNVPEMQGNSHLFSVYDDKSTVQLNTPLHLSSELHEVKDHSVSICTFSPEPFWQASQVVDFILYYAALGANNVYLYHRGIGDQVVSALRSLIQRRGNLTIHLASWNHPSGSFDLPLVQHDCAWRSGAGRLGLVFALPMSHYLVLPTGTSLESFLSKISHQEEQQQPQQQVLEARITRHSLCSNPPNTEAVPPSRLTRMMRNPTKDIPRAVVRWTYGVPAGHWDSIRISKIDPHSAKFLTFEPCSVASGSGGLEKMDEDPAVRRFLTLAQNIPFYKV